MCWRPNAGGAETLKNQFLVGGTDGAVKLFGLNYSSSKFSEYIQGTEILSLAYSKTATQFATGAKDYKIRLYDDAKLQKIGEIT